MLLFNFSAKSKNMILFGKRDVYLKCQITAHNYYGIVLAIALCDCSKTDVSFEEILKTNTCFMFGFSWYFENVSQGH